MANQKVTVPIGRFTIEVEVSDIKEAFRELSPYFEVLTENACGQCGKTNCIRPNHRVVNNGKHHYYELQCVLCGAKLDLGQNQDAETLFPKRKLEDGSYDRQHRGWYHYNRQSNKDGNAERF